MEVKAYVLNIPSEEAIAPRQNLVSWLKSKITAARDIPSHVQAGTSIDLAASA